MLSRELRGKLIFALVWNVIAAVGIWSVVYEPKEGDQWLLILAGLLVLGGLALLFDVIVRYLAWRRDGASSAGEDAGVPYAGRGSPNKNP